MAIYTYVCSYNHIVAIWAQGICLIAMYAENLRATGPKVEGIAVSSFHSLTKNNVFFHYVAKTQTYS